MTDIPPAGDGRPERRLAGRRGPGEDGGRGRVQVGGPDRGWEGDLAAEGRRLRCESPLLPPSCCMRIPGAAWP